MTKSKLIVFRATPEDKRLLCAVASRQGSTMSGVLRGLIHKAAVKADNQPDRGNKPQQN